MHPLWTLHSLSAQLRVVIILCAVLANARCQPKPLVVPIDDVLLSNGASMRGVWLGVGTPRQNISMLATAGRNETFIYSVDGPCRDKWSSSSACTTDRGGRYDRGDSSTGASARIVPSDIVDADWITDLIFMQPNFALRNFSFGNPRDSINPGRKGQAQLGLDRKSSLLNMLKDTGNIGSRAYSIFWGLVGGKTPGSIVFGGFDDRFAGVATKNFTSNLNFGVKGCESGIVLTVNDMSLNWPNGTETSLFGSRAESMRACLDTSYPGLMTIPKKYWEAFRDAAKLPMNESRTDGINLFTLTFPSEGLYPGDLTFSLENSLSIRIPNSELVVDDLYISNATGEIETGTRRNLVLNPLEGVNENDLPFLGRLFLTSAYLSVNHDSNTFTLWQADTLAQNTNLRALDSENRVIDDVCRDTSDEGQNKLEDTKEEGKTQLTSKPQSKSAIAGIAVGVGIAIVTLSLIGWVLFRNRKARATNARKIADGPIMPPYHSRPGFNSNPSEMLSEMLPVTEKATFELCGRHVVAELEGNGRRE